MTASPRRTASILGALALAVVLGLGTASGAFKYLDEGMSAPGIAGTDLVSGDPVTFDFQDGEVAAVVFWATWSPRSLELLEDLARLAEEHGESGFRVLAVNVEGQHMTPQLRERIRAAIDSIAPPYPVVIDKDLETFHTYGVIAVPTLALVDSEGVLRYAPSGYSITIRDTIAQATRILLGKETEPVVATPIVTGRRPNSRAARYYGLAVRMSNKGLPERAQESLARAVEMDSLFAAPWVLSGELEMKAGRTEAAVDHFAKAVALDSTSVVAVAGFGRALLRAGRVEDARHQLEVACELDGFYVPALLGLGSCLLELGETAEAALFMEKALDLNPRDPETLYSIGRMKLADGDTAAAVAAYRTAMEQMVGLPVGPGN